MCGKFQRRAGCARECCEQKHGATGLTGQLVGQRRDPSNNTRWPARLQISDFLSKPSQSLNPAHARDASEPSQPGETPSPGMARKAWLQQGLQQGWNLTDHEKSAHARDASEPAGNRTPHQGEHNVPLAQQQWDWNSWSSQEPQYWEQSQWQQQSWNSGWRDSNWGSASYDGGRGDLKEIHHKDLKPPEAYGGNIDKWKEWSKSFMRYLRRRDRRWPDLLEKVQELKGKPVTSEDEKKWAWELYIYIYI